MSLYERVADLPLAVEGFDTSRRERETSSDFTRVTTVVELHGGGQTGRGEDVTYDAAAHDPLQAGPGWDLAGEYTLDSFSERLDDLVLFESEPDHAADRQYRRWALESAALDLALRQAGESLGSALDREYDPVQFVASTRLGDPPTADRIHAFVEAYPDIAFKLDPTSDWSAALCEELADTGAVRILDFKGLYEGTEVDQEPDPALYRRVLSAFPDAVIEDPNLTDETRPLFDGNEGRVSWDVPITGVESVRDRPFEPRWLNIKPSRFGTLASLLDTIEYCERREIRCYGGGQFELGLGRGQIQALASLCYPDAPNDVAPGGYNDPEVRTDLPTSPLDPGEPSVGFGF